MAARAHLPNELTPEQKRFSELCGPPPLVEGEDAARYQCLLVGVVKAVEPADVPEWLWVRDIVDLEWEILRYRDAKAHLISSAEAQARQHLSFDSTFGVGSSEIPASNVIAHAVAGILTDLRRFDLMLMSMEIRRDNAYREIEHRRANRGKRQRVTGRRAAFGPVLIEDRADN